MKPVNTRAYFTLLQLLLLLLLVILFAILKKEAVIDFFYTSETGLLGLVLNAGIVALFVLGLFRIVVVLFAYAHEQTVMHAFVERLQGNVSEPTYKLDTSALIVRRFHAVQILGQQNAPIDQGALASVTAAEESSRFILIRFVHNILILGGMFGTIVSLSVALMGAAGLLDSMDNLQKMGTIIDGMSTALHTTITAILCYVAYSYFHLRLQDARTQLLANLEEVTTLYIAPRFRSVESSLMRDVAILTQELRRASESMNKVQDRFLQAGERLQLAVDDLQTQIIRIGNSISTATDNNSEHIRTGSEDLQVIRELIREGFRLEDRVQKSDAAVTAERSGSHAR